MPSQNLAAEGLETQLRHAFAELRSRLSAGVACRAEDLLSSHPELASDPELALQLIHAEFTIRRELGQKPNPAECFERFPSWRDRLEHQFQADGLDTSGNSEDAATAAQTTRFQPEHGPVTVAYAKDLQPEQGPAGADGIERQLGRFTLVEEIGRGGMGVVLKVHDPVLNRVVALKMIRGGFLAREDEVERFYREARAVAQLDHPHIVKIHDIGKHADQPYFTMAYVGGGSLAEHMERFQADLRAAVALVEKLARAIHHAHERGVIHRDLKPSNVMLDAQGEPCISDFGLAKVLEADGELTQTGQVIGTPAYMAPEQALGRASQATPQSDVWSLGVILYELLTGRRPFKGQDRQQVEQQILTAAPLLPRTARPALDGGLETIVLKCLEKRPARRYASALALADDLGNWLRGVPIEARPITWTRRLGRRFGPRRKWQLFSVALLGLLVALAGAVFVFRPWLMPAPVVSPEDKERERQKKAVAELHSDLTANRRVRLLDEAGRPKYYRWRTERDRSRVPLEPKDGSLFLESLTTCLLELLPNLPVDHYEFSADVLHEASNRGHVGIYFAAEERLTPAGPEQEFCAFTFAERGTRAQRAFFCLNSYREGDADHAPESCQTKIWSKKFPPGAAWHRINVSVTPETIEARWDGELVYTMDRSKTQTNIDAWWITEHPGDDPPPAPAFPPRGGLGLIIYQSTAQFKNVEVVAQ